MSRGLRVKHLLPFLTTIFVDPFCYLCFVSVMLSFCSLQPCGHLLRKGLPLDSIVCDIFLCYFTFPFGALGQL